MSMPDEQRLAEFCRALPALRVAARAEGWDTWLEHAEADLVDQSVNVADTLDQLWDYLGLFGPKRGDSGFTPVPRQDPAPPPEGAYLCPVSAADRRCTRAESREPGAAVPECPLRKVPLMFSS